MTAPQLKARQQFWKQFCAYIYACIVVHDFLCTGLQGIRCMTTPVQQTCLLLMFRTRTAKALLAKTHLLYSCIHFFCCSLSLTSTVFFSCAIQPCISHLLLRCKLLNAISVIVTLHIQHAQYIQYDSKGLHLAFVCSTACCTAPASRKACRTHRMVSVLRTVSTCRVSKACAWA